MTDGKKKIIAAILGVVFVGYMLVTGIADLVNKKDIYTIRVDQCVEFFTIEHSISGLIPVGKDHYYLGINNETLDAAIIKASKGWYTKRFGADGKSVEPGGLEITCLAKKPGDFEVQKELEAGAAQLEGLNMIIPAGYSLETDYMFNAISKLVLLGAAVILVIGGIKISRANGEIRGPIVKVYLVVCIVFLVLLLRALI